MTDERTTDDVEPKGEEAPPRSPQDVADKPGDHEMPVTGRGGDMTGDDESLARRPAQDEDEVDGDTESGGTPPGTSTHGA